MTDPLDEGTMAQLLAMDVTLFAQAGAACEDKLLLCVLIDC